MVCIAAFIVLCLISVVVGAISIFYRPIGKRYWKTFKKAWGCVGKRLTLQKCETGFKEDIKNSILAKVIVRKPKLVKPIGIGIEVVSVLIVIVTVWSLLAAAKGGLALYVYGTCDVTTPSACSLDATEACTIDSERLGFVDSIRQFKLHVYVVNWFGEFGEIFAALPARMRNWDAMDYIPEGANFFNTFDESKPVALDIFDPGCSVCRQSYINMKESGFFDRYNVAMMVYPIAAADGNGSKFKNSYVLARYIVAAGNYEATEMDRSLDWAIVNRLFTEYDEKKRQYQDAFNSSYSEEEAQEVLKMWMSDFGLNAEEVAMIAERSESEEVGDLIEANRRTVHDRIRTKKIPTLIFDGRRHAGIFEE